jgi:hypothetical protein
MDLLNMNALGKFLIIAGVALVVVGALFLLAGKTGWFDKVPLGRLPGDIRIERENFKFYFPLTTCILISIALTLIFWILKRWKM